jgi:hypothetical protein
MKVAQELLGQVTAFVEGRTSLPELYLWLAEHVQAIAHADDPHAAELSDETWILIAEWTDNLRDEPSVRGELAEFLARRTSRSARPVSTPTS